MKLFRFFGQYRSVKFRLPRDCCQWCEAEARIAKGEINALKQQVEELNRTQIFDRSLALEKLKIESALDLFTRALKAEASRRFFVSDPRHLTEVFSAAYEVVRSVLESPTTEAATIEARNNFSKAVHFKSNEYIDSRKNGHQPLPDHLIPVRDS